MIAPARQAHRVIWSALALALPALLIAVYYARAYSGEQPAQAVSEEAAEARVQGGCWGDIEVQLIMTPATLDVIEDRAEDSLMAAHDWSRRMTVSGPNGYRMNLRDPASVPGAIEVLSQTRVPEPHAYWMPGIVYAGPGLPAGARHLGKIDWRSPLAFGGTVDFTTDVTLLLYSPVNDETVGVIHVHGDELLFGVCP